ncbi:hypothetical protein FRC17_005403 [Serendipita sp. 399]|nr:hypothetical protein FRC17_005403 [Serendipita sp. 399]
MTLMSRNDLQTRINKQIENGDFDVDHGEVTCNCFEKIKEELEYSILSHRWGDREVTFNHLQILDEQLLASGQNLQIPEKLAMLHANPAPKAPSKTSLDKLSNFLKISEDKQCKYAWADTVCINKESSAELDESIRSMYAWYRDSRICIVHLSETDYLYEMKQDPWFTRGWTLQELLAPRQFAFYSKGWKQITRSNSEKGPIGEVDQKEAKGEASLWVQVASITGIDIGNLLNFEPGLRDISKRMKWAARRKTTRIEDMAYCLIGIFNINLSIAYGEKEGAFYRLQVEILQNSDDVSLFDWQGPRSIHNSMLAASPACFSEALGLRKITLLPASDDPTFAQTNVGIRIPLAIYLLNQDWLSGRRLNLAKTPSVFSILGASSKPNYYVMLLLGEGDQPRRYERLALVEEELDINSFKQVPVVVYIK